MRRGFTMIEIFITVIIMAVLSAIAVPIYNQTVLKHEANQAVGYLRAIRFAEKAYFANNGVYLGCGDAGAIRTNLGVEVTTARYTFSVATGATTFTATASRISNPVTITLNQDGGWGGTYSPLPTN
jgi:type IV pilus assembly protein PilE